MSGLFCWVGEWMGRWVGGKWGKGCLFSSIKPAVKEGVLVCAFCVCVLCFEKGGLG